MQVQLYVQYGKNKRDFWRRYVLQFPGNCTENTCVFYLKTCSMYSQISHTMFAYLLFHRQYFCKNTEHHGMLTKYKNKTWFNGQHSCPSTGIMNV